MLPNTAKLLAEIEEAFESASDNAVRIVCSEAREILKADDGLDEFIMAMGGCFFTIKEGGKYDTREMTDEEYEAWEESDDYLYSHAGIVENDRRDEPFQESFFDMVDDLVERFNVTGFPVRFTAKSLNVHNWGDTTKNPVVYVDTLDYIVDLDPIKSYNKECK